MTSVKGITHALLLVVLWTELTFGMKNISAVFVHFWEGDYLERTVYVCRTGLNANGGSHVSRG